MQEAFGFTDEHLRELARNSFEASFLAAGKENRISEFVRLRGHAGVRPLFVLRNSLLKTKRV